MKKQEEKQLLVFSYGLPLICFILAWRQYVKHGLTIGVECLVAAAGLFLLTAVFLPLLSKILFKYWMKASGLIGRVVTILILSVFFFCVITPVSIILRLMGKDYMRLRIKGAAASYWVRRENKKEDYTRQF